MGVGKPDDIVGAVKRGVDMMDRSCRPALGGRVRCLRATASFIKKRHKDDPRPLDYDCTCPARSNYSRAYLHHTFRSQEIISSMLLTWHNPIISRTDGNHASGDCSRLLRRI